MHLPLGYVPSMDRWHGRSGCDRARWTSRCSPARTPRRERFLGGAASQLWEWRCDLRMFSWHQPILGGGPTFLAGDEKYGALADTRILLNVHRSADPYFEWARVIEAMANGCVVVTETSTGTAPLVAGEHFVEAPLEYLAEQAVALALDEPRRARLADGGVRRRCARARPGALLDVAARRGPPGGRVRAAPPGRPCCRRLADRGSGGRLGAAGAAPLVAGGRRDRAAAQADRARSSGRYLDQVDHTRAWSGRCAW